MGQQANITAFDGASTPVVHTLVAVGVGKDEVVGSFAEYRELLASVPTYAQPNVTVSKKILKSGIERVSLTTKIPVMESISGQNASGYTAAPKVAFTDTMVTTGYFSGRSTGVNRKLIRQLHTNILNGIATTVTPVTTHDVAQLVDNSIIPT